MIALGDSWAAGVGATSGNGYASQLHPALQERYLAVHLAVAHELGDLELAPGQGLEVALAGANAGATGRPPAVAPARIRLAAQRAGAELDVRRRRAPIRPPPRDDQAIPRRALPLLSVALG
jgi:hypothetical protein